MEIIYQPRQSGKTLSLIKQADNFNGYILTMNARSCEHIMNLAEKHGYKINFPLTWDEFLLGRFYPNGVKKIYIDNADLILQRLANERYVALEAITITKE